MDPKLIEFIVIGFLAQMVDGSLGMAYGVLSNTFLLSTGLSPALASASVHTAEFFTTFVSGFSHFKLKNIDKKLFTKLLIPGIIGGVLGAYVLTSIDGKVIKPYITGYLIIMGAIVLYRAFNGHSKTGTEKGSIPLGLAGGFCDAIGGGGWGPIVTSTLVARGHNTRLVVGSVNAAEFFVTTAQAIAFFIAISINWQIVLGLTIGGVIAAPLAAFACSRIPVKGLTFLVGLVIIAVNLFALWGMMFK